MALKSFITYEEVQWQNTQLIILKLRIKDATHAPRKENGTKKLIKNEIAQWMNTHLITLKLRIKDLTLAPRNRKWQKSFLNMR